MKANWNFNPAGALLAFNGQRSISATSQGATLPPLLFRLNKVLVPIDFTELSKKALGYAVQFANHKGGRIVLLHVLEPLPRGGKSSKFDQRVSSRMDEAERRLLELGLNELDPALTCDLLVQMGKPYREIVNTAKALSADLIVMPTRGYRRVRRTLKLSTAELVVRLAPCPVLVIRASEPGLFRPPPWFASACRKAGPNVQRTRL